MLLLRLRWRGRWLVLFVVALTAFVSAAMAAYHYRKRDHVVENRAKLQELATLPLTEVRPARTDWPQWRGAGRDGVSTEIERLAPWPDGGPRLIWEHSLGEGHSSVAVANDRLFTMGREGDHEYVVSWHADTGREIWRHQYPCSFRNEHGNGPRSTPAVDGDLVFSVGADGMMHALKALTAQAHGEVVWKKDLRDEFKAEVPKWGVSFSPLVDGERVFIQPGGPDGNSLAALDKHTGKILWQRYSDPASYSSPVAASFQNQRQILFFTASRLMAVDPATGALLWDYDWPSDQQCNIATPVVVQDYVFISSGHGPGCAVLKIEKTGDRWQAVLVYSHRRMRNHFSSCVRHGDHLYGFDHGVLTCMDFRSGAIQWKERGFGKGSLLLAGASLIVYGEDGVVALADANADRFCEKARFAFSTQSRCWAVPVLAGGRLYVRDSKKLACFDVNNLSR